VDFCIYVRGLALINLEDVSLGNGKLKCTGSVGDVR